MAFRNPVTSLPADAVTPGTLSGSILQTDNTMGRIRLVSDASAVGNIPAGQSAIELYQSTDESTAHTIATGNAPAGTVRAGMVGGSAARNALILRGNGNGGSARARAASIELGSTYSTFPLVGNGQADLSLDTGTDSGKTSNAGRLWITGDQGNVDLMQLDAAGVSMLGSQRARRYYVTSTSVDVVSATAGALASSVDLSPAGFTSAPVIFAMTFSTGLWTATVGAVTTTSVAINVRVLDNVARSATVGVRVLAIQF